LRIIGGKYGGRTIVPTSGITARPTTDFAKEGLFNILNNRLDLESVSVLDLFSGTGSIAFEFASRGAALVHLVEKDIKHVAGIKHNIKRIGITNIKAIHIDAKAYLKACRIKYDLVFADPPYDLEWLRTIPDLVLNSGVVNEGGMLILEHPRSMNFVDHERFMEHRNYGNVNFSFFSFSSQ
jgi:16S rRNA (guanine(966)-N(2))-methyltransferase RsmD